MAERETALEALRFLETNRTFLGREFLTWLWFVSETQHHKVKVEGLGEFMLYVDDKIVLNAAGGSVHENILKGGTPAYATEAQTALLNGKLVHEAKFILQKDDQEWLWAMKADDLALRGVRLPNVAEGDAETHMSRRFEFMEMLTSVVDTLFREYISIRLSNRFKSEAENLALWIGSKATHQTAEAQAPF